MQSEFIVTKLMKTTRIGLTLSPLLTVAMLFLLELAQAGTRCAAILDTQQTYWFEEYFAKLENGALVMSDGLSFQDQIHFTHVQSVDNSGLSAIQIGDKAIEVEIKMAKRVLLGSKLYQISDHSLLTDSLKHHWSRPNLRSAFSIASGSAIKDRTRLLRWAAMSFVSKNPNPNVQTKMVLRVRSSDRKIHTLLQEFRSQQRSDWVSLYVRNFQNISGGKDIVSLLQEDALIEAVGFIFEKTNNMEIKGPIQISKEIALEFALTNDYKIAEELLFDVHRDGFDRLSPVFINRLGEKEKIPPEVLRRVTAKFFASMKKRENQEKARSVILSGEQNVKEELARFDWQAEVNFQGRVKMEDIMSAIASGQIPVERSEFGELHGQWAHHAQILAGLYDLSPSEVQIANAFIRIYVAGGHWMGTGNIVTFFNWPLWNQLFDSRSENSVHSNRFWRDLTSP